VRRRGVRGKSRDIHGSNVARRWSGEAGRSITGKARRAWNHAVTAAVEQGTQGLWGHVLPSHTHTHTHILSISLFLYNNTTTQRDRDRGNQFIETDSTCNTTIRSQTQTNPRGGVDSEHSRGRKKRETKKKNMMISRRCRSFEFGGIRGVASWLEAVSHLSPIPCAP
jgi:hypothetical protein